MMPLHPLLARQVKRHLNGMIPDDVATQDLLSAVSEAYANMNQNLERAESSLCVMSDELNQRNTALSHELEEHCNVREALVRERAEQAALIVELAQAHSQLLQSEKLASIGQLAAGVAHEINNPIGYVFSNFGSLRAYISDLNRFVEAAVASEMHISDATVRAELVQLRKDIDYDFLRSDLSSLMDESQEGIERVRKIVLDLKEFSHVDASSEWLWSDLHRGLDSTLNIATNEIKYRADVVRDFGVLPQIQCLPSQLNQVFMNLLVNAAHAMENVPQRGCITVRTGADTDEVFVEIQDTGCGMNEETMARIFDPFFTTKPVGKGTGLGLSLSYGIVQKHHGNLKVTSTPGVGTSFRVTLPIRQAETTQAKETA